MICVGVDSSGNLINEACSSSSLVVFTQDELAAQIEANSKNPFDITPSDAVALSWLIIGTWLVAWSFKMTARVFQQGVPEK